jgi:hypothetical protein
VVVTASPRLPGLELPDLSISEREALVEFWGVYEPHFDEVMDAVEADAREHPELVVFVGAVEPAERRERREQIRSAIVDDDWHPYLARTTRPEPATPKPAWASEPGSEPQGDDHAADRRRAPSRAGAAG